MIYINLDKDKNLAPPEEVHNNAGLASPLEDGVILMTLMEQHSKKGDEYFFPSKKDFMINYQVQNIEGLINKLKENGVTILDSIATYDYGKFVHIMDSEGNKIELWEPTD